MGRILLAFRGFFGILFHGKLSDELAARLGLARQAAKAAAPQQPLPPASAIFIATGPDEFYVAGKGVSLAFSPNTPGPEIDGLGTVEEGAFVNGRWVPGRRLAGDETIQGQTVSLWKRGIQRVTLYRYR